MNVQFQENKQSSKRVEVSGEMVAYIQPTSFRDGLLAPFRESVFSLGLSLVAVSWAIFSLYEVFGEASREDGGNIIMIMIHYGLALLFTIALWLNGNLAFSSQRWEADRPARWMGLLLWLISAYALNRQLPVFQQSTAWLCWVLVLIGTAMTLFSWKPYLSVRAQQLLYAVLAAGWWLFVYMAFYVAGLYPISIPLLIGLGLSAHTFVPLLFAIALGKRLWQDGSREEHTRLGIYTGLCLPIIFTSLFLYGWVSDLNRIDQTRQQATVRKTSDLPDWVLIAQQLKLDHSISGWITSRLLRSNRVFDQGRIFESNGWGLDGLTALDDVRQHDPLVVIASRLYPEDVSNDAERLFLLKVLSGERHGTEEKFWSGRHLTTQDVVSQVRIWPQFRISYTEQTFRIRNQARRTTEEALLTFHLAPGSVVSSMSLWVNGREEPARLTTVAKADSAYRRVVGVESQIQAHDPSVVYWQEGDRVTVRIFPCIAGQDRRVKLGITSPLRVTDDQLVYQPPYIEGPSTASASEFITVDFAAPPSGLKTPWLFTDLTTNTLTHKGHYNTDWSIRFQAPPLSADAFVLNHQAYHVDKYQPNVESFIPTDVYLDVNKAWQKDEFTTAFRTATQRNNCRVWVFDDGLKQLTESDLEATYERLSQQTFSLFPIYRIATPATALLITKETPVSPILTDLKGSPFADRLKGLATQSTPVRTFCYATNTAESGVPAYLKTLAELHVLNVIQGDVPQLTNVFEKHQFPRLNADERCVMLPETGITIRVTPQPSTARIPTSAPDHLARLFLYNQLLAQIGPRYFVPNYQTDTLIRQAQQAHVVSPLSSLVVLETEKDYKRFGIQKDHSGLDNATLKEEGAVPEPHEWALLLLLVGLIGWLYWRKHYALH